MIRVGLCGAGVPAVSGSGVVVCPAQPEVRTRVACVESSVQQLEIGTENEAAGSAALIDKQKGWKNTTRQVRSGQGKPSLRRVSLYVLPPSLPALPGTLGVLV